MLKIIKILLIVTTLFGLSNSGFTQNVFPLMPKYYQPVDSSIFETSQKEDDTKKPTLLKQHEKFSYSVSLGTGFSSFGNNMSMMSSYISPSVNYQVNSKLNLTVNGMIMQNNMSGLEGALGSGAQYSYNSSPSNYGISGTINYQLSERWSIFGDGAYFENQSVFNDYRAQMYNDDFKTFSIGVGYKVNEKFQFHLQYRYSDGLDNLYNNYSPFYNTMLSPYRNAYNNWDY